MLSERTITKTKWSDIGPLRKPNSAWRLGKAARWFEKKLDLPAGTISFVKPDGARARSDKTLRTFRNEWMKYKAQR